MTTNDVMYLRMAYREAAKSPDTSTQNGVIIRDVAGKYMAMGHNSPTAGFYVEDEHVIADKYAYTEHAERAAIFNAARYGVRTLGATMYCPWASCQDCARAIVCAGIKRLVRHADAMQQTPKRWRQTTDCGEMSLRFGGVEIVEIEGYVGGPNIRLDGQLWIP